MMEHKLNTIEDFVLNESFRQWVLKPDLSLQVKWNKWLKEHPERQQMVDQARSIILAMSQHAVKLPSELRDDIEQSIEDRLDFHEASLDTELEKTSPSIDYSPPHQSFAWARVAAIVTLLMISGFLIINFDWLQNQILNKPAKSDVSENFIIKETALGQKSTFYLTDGTKVVLNSGSSLSYKKNFDTDLRLVTLTGEGYFEVTKDPDRPFRVEGENLITTAIGTAFNVRNFKEESIERVSLVEGEVKVDHKVNAHSFRSFLLEPQGQISYDKEQDIILEESFDIEDVVGWKNGILKFKSCTESEFYKRLEVWYGVTFEINGSPKNKWVLNARFNNPSLESVLKSVGYTMDFEYAINENIVVIDYK